MADKKTGVRAEPVLIDKLSGRPITEQHVESMPGPATDEQVLARFERRRLKREGS